MLLFYEFLSPPSSPVVGVHALCYFLLSAEYRVILIGFLRCRVQMWGLSSIFPYFLVQIFDVIYVLELSLLPCNFHFPFSFSAEGGWFPCLSETCNVVVWSRCKQGICPNKGRNM
jgi:hypothetical protein